MKYLPLVQAYWAEVDGAAEGAGGEAGTGEGGWTEGGKNPSS